MWILKYDTNDLICEIVRNRLTDIENRSVTGKWEGA